MLSLDSDVFCFGCVCCRMCRIVEIHPVQEINKYEWFMKFKVWKIIVQKDQNNK